MRIKNTLLLLTLLVLSIFSFTGNVLANETSEVEDVILEALNGDSELKVGFEEEVEKELEKLSNEELKLLVDNLSKKESLSSKETTVLRSAEKGLEERYSFPSSSSRSALTTFIYASTTFIMVVVLMASVIALKEFFS